MVANRRALVDSWLLTTTCKSIVELRKPPNYYSLNIWAEHIQWEPTTTHLWVFVNMPLVISFMQVFWQFSQQSQSAWEEGRICLSYLILLPLTYIFSWRLATLPPHSWPSPVSIILRKSPNQMTASQCMPLGLMNCRWAAFDVFKIFHQIQYLRVRVCAWPLGAGPSSWPLGPHGRGSFILAPGTPWVRFFWWPNLTKKRPQSGAQIEPGSHGLKLNRCATHRISYLRRM